MIRYLHATGPAPLARSRRWPRARSARPLLPVLLLGLALLALLSCRQDAPMIDFKNLEVPDSPVLAPTSPDGPLRLAIASVFSAPLSSSIYRDLAAYLSLRLDRPVELVLGRNYAETNALLRSGEVTLALVCPKPYVEGNESFGLELLAAPVVNGSLEYSSLLIVGINSPDLSIADLAGKSFAFSDPSSHSGRLAPMYELSLLGRSPDTFFGHAIFTYSHDNAVRAVAGGVVHAAAISSLVFDYLQVAEPSLVSGVKVIERWGPYGINPIVVSPSIDATLKARIRTVLLQMDEDPEGKAILSALRVDRWDVPEDSLYDSVREMRSYLNRVPRP
jgi:phosphonate transport system substrate-binding protein